MKENNEWYIGDFFNNDEKWRVNNIDNKVDKKDLQAYDVDYEDEDN